jgi:hypothetical protein
VQVVSAALRVETDAAPDGLPVEAGVEAGVGAPVGASASAAAVAVRRWTAEAPRHPEPTTTWKVAPSPGTGRSVAVGSAATTVFTEADHRGS